ncbi:MAG: hypothetical protein IPM29_10790 [Planctomycetes bacterium]|nr:hypothetical protein [Planctomycetota bacterium]
MERDRAERDPDFKQPVPYCAVRRGAEVFVVERLAAQGEQRLHGRASLGIGGHVGPEDGPPRGSLQRALWRELREELRLPPGALPAARPLGLINDDSTAVGSVHLGLAFELALAPDLPHESVAVREISKMVGGFRPLVGATSLWHDAANLETWSALLVRAPGPTPRLARSRGPVPRRAGKLRPGRARPGRRA